MNDKQSKTYVKQRARSQDDRRQYHRDRGNSRSYNKDVQEVRNKDKRANDYTWYAINDTIGRAVGSIPYNRFPGLRNRLGIDSERAIGEGVGIATQASHTTVPGVMAIEYVPGIGRTTTATDAPNIAMRSIYSFVRHQNSGHANYEAPDLMLYLLAMDDIYSSYLELVRVYKAAATYFYINRNVPDLIIRALGYNPDNIRENLAQFRGQLNICAAKISSMAVPDVIDLFKRHAFMTAAVYTDSTSQMGQFYCFRKTGRLLFDPLHSTGGRLVYTPYYNFNETCLTNRTWEQGIQDLNEQIDKIISDEDSNIMSGDILKAYGRDRLYVLAGVDENATLDILYDENVLSQIHNSHALYLGQAAEDSFNIQQLDGILKYVGANVLRDSMEASWITSVILQGEVFFNSHKDDPDWKDTLEWTRLMLGIDMASNPTFDESRYYFKSGTEIVSRYSIIYYTANATNNDLGIEALEMWTGELIIPENFGVQEMKKIALISQFDWAPLRYFGYLDFQPNSSVYPSGLYTLKDIHVYGDLKKYTMLSGESIVGLHDAAVMAEFDFNLTV